jgi:hypothetical protein
MELLTYSLTLIICFFGIFFGIVLAFSAKEEIKPGKKYFILMQKIILLIILIILLNLFDINFYIKLFAYALLIFLMELNLKNEIFYALLGVAFFFASPDRNLFFLISSLIFFYGFPTGSLFAYKKLKNNAFFVFRKSFLSYFWFLLFAFLLRLFIN